MKTIDNASVRLIYTDYHRKLIHKLTQVCPGAYIFNAPRPLAGHETWTGDFISGVFYAAVFPDGERADWMIDQNIRLDAKLLSYFDKQDVIRCAREWAKEYDLTYYELLEYHDFADLVVHYIQEHQE